MTINIWRRREYINIVHKKNISFYRVVFVKYYITICVVENQQRLQRTREEPMGYVGRIDASCRARHRSREHRGILITLASGGAVTGSPPPHASIEVAMAWASVPPLPCTSHRRRQERCRRAVEM
jgi:hypothetical protein